jgi:uncharacterized paraquat-inducible protein A
MTEARSRRSGCLVPLYALAAPVYLVRFFFIALRVLRLWRISRLGYVKCPHCGEDNAVDALTTCPRCKTTEYGNRLRCTGCGTRGTAFPCDACRVTIHCF